MEQGWTLTAAAEAAGVSVRTSKWFGPLPGSRAKTVCSIGSSAPRSIAHRTPEDRVGAIVALRRLRMTAAEIAEMPGDAALDGLGGARRGSGSGRLGRLELEPAVRYERKRPGELLHIDVKNLGRIDGGSGHRVGGTGQSRQ